MSVQATYDREADIAWFRFPGFDARNTRTEQADWGLHDVDRQTGETVALEFWRASERLPAELLGQLPHASRRRSGGTLTHGRGLTRPRLPGRQP
jgi:uncharacterized protein YuzE